ncbi:hypothetical protein HQ39_04090 [Porphyromonas sp. COT-108 OH2963]|nr:hypothetical protein HQ39_04090 [Porphyromonas sp. COT-108 OH2963]
MEQLPNAINKTSKPVHEKTSTAPKEERKSKPDLPHTISAFLLISHTDGYSASEPSQKQPIQSTAMEDKKAKIAFFTLFGVILPLGAVWAPFLVKTTEHSDRKFRMRLVSVEIIVAIVALSLSTAEWIKQIERIMNGAGEIDTQKLSVMLLYPLLVLCIGLGVGFYRLYKR